MAKFAKKKKRKLAQYDFNFSNQFLGFFYRIKRSANFYFYVKITAS